MLYVSNIKVSFILYIRIQYIITIYREFELGNFWSLTIGLHYVIRAYVHNVGQRQWKKGAMNLVSYKY